jgi:hypothetical protein
MRMDVSTEAVKKRIPQTVLTRWHFVSHTVNSVYGHSLILAECFEKIMETFAD